jgi:16S rRNA (cytosine1402-N4)-methyltransferase
MTNIKHVYHKPVLVREVVEGLALKPGGIYVDATFGGGGHTRALLDAQPDCHIVALDWDKKALEQNGEPLLEEYPGRITLVWGNFSRIDMLLKKQGIDKVDGILADFGTSQEQLLHRAGFSFATDTPLDMRMSLAHHKTTAADVLNYEDEKTLADIFYEFGEERKSRAAARAIVEYRKRHKFVTTQDLVYVLTPVLGAARPGRMHPATRIFQALRIYVNKELDNIISFLPAALRVLKPGARLACITFHSLEDRLVKQFFKDNAQAGMQQCLEIITPRGIVPSDEECDENPSARSSRLRIAQRCEAK